MTLLEEPRTREEMAARHRAARDRMERAGRRHVAERRVPPFARMNAAGGPYAPEDVLDLVAGALAGGRSDPQFRAAGAYWLFGFTDLAPLCVAQALGLRGTTEAVDLMRAYARMSGLPAIDLRGET
ncbi:hypothetical protein [Hansschlegelia zhihuaiae]|uniref:Uncharacterized protein n=1 Tax=Hansschlegelia zhihuaiae TaxID=405005 RepID=A0A4Q0MFM9_9HYPH|nr:hypothetical protein [Hansschlegelia zhihuaiae]RXF72105.1 hypothetical protein EK403_14950 [Hansschlegelia zhihuaiae]